MSASLDISAKITARDDKDDPELVRQRREARARSRQWDFLENSWMEVDREPRCASQSEQIYISRHLVELIRKQNTARFK